jgi:peptidoglycan biosynthesis protein MviN/MurJ (putative lipid II flippase)
MKKIKRSVLMPLALLIYLIFIAIYAYPGRNPEINVTWLQYAITAGVTLACIIVLRILMVKREKMRKKITTDRIK